MKKIIFIAAIQVFLLSILFADCHAQQIMNADLEEAKKAIEESNKIYFQALTKGDLSIFTNCYAKDCWIMPPNASALCGPEASLDFFRAIYKAIDFRNRKFITIDIFGTGEEFVTEVGFWQSFDADNKLLDNGKFIILWKKTTEGWKRFRDMFNSD